MGLLTCAIQGTVPERGPCIVYSVPRNRLRIVCALVQSVVGEASFLGKEIGPPTCVWSHHWDRTDMTWTWLTSTASAYTLSWQSPVYDARMENPYLNYRGSL